MNIHGMIRLGIAIAAWAACPGARGESLAIATYNVGNYGPADRLTEAGYRSDYPKPEDEKSALRAVIGRLGADILAIQEMGTEAHLEELRADLKAEGIDYPYAAWGEGTDRERHLALLSRRPLLSVRNHGDLEFRYLGGRERVRRGLLEATVEAAGGAITLFVVHLKSRLTERPDDPGGAARRSAEAVAVRDCICRRFPDRGTARFVILGDCNDSRGSRTLRELERRGRTVVAVRLDAADSRGETWTEARRREGAYSQLDQILVSPALAPAAAPGNARIEDGPQVETASDHRPVCVTLTCPGP